MSPDGETDDTAGADGLLNKSHSVIAVQTEQIQMYANALKSAGSKLHITNSPDKRHRRSVLAGSTSRFWSILAMTCIIGAMMVPIWQLTDAVYATLVDAIATTAPASTEGVKWIPVPSQATIQAIETVMYLSAALLVSLISYPAILAMQPRPKHGDSTSANVATSGKNGANPKVFYTVGQGLLTRVKGILREGIGSGQYTEETRRIAGELGVDPENLSADDLVIIEFAFREVQPMDALIQGWTVDDVVDTDSHIGLLSESVASELNQATLPVWFDVSVAARPRTKSRRECKEERLCRSIDNATLARYLKLWSPLHRTDERDEEELKASNRKRLEQLPDANARLFDAAAALVAVVETDEDQKQLATCADVVSNCLEEVTNDFIEVGWRSHKNSRWPWRKLRFQRIKRRLDRGGVPYKSPTRLIGSKKRNNMVLTSEQVMGWLAISGDGSYSSKQALGPTPRDQTPTGPPPGDASDTIETELPYGGDDEEGTADATASDGDGTPHQDSETASEHDPNSDTKTEDADSTPDWIPEPDTDTDPEEERDT